MSKLIKVERDLSVSGQSLVDLNTFRFKAMRRFTIQPVVEAEMPIKLTAQGRNTLPQNGVPTGVVTKLAAIQDMTFLGETAFKTALHDSAGLADTEIEAYLHEILDAADKGQPVDVLKQVLAYFVLEGAAPVTTQPVTGVSIGPSFSGLVFVGLVTNFQRLSEFESDMDKIQKDLEDASMNLVKITFKQYG